MQEIVAATQLYTILQTCRVEFSPVSVASIHGMVLKLVKNELEGVQVR